MVIDTLRDRAYSGPATVNPVDGLGGLKSTADSTASRGFFVSGNMASLMGGPCGRRASACRLPVDRSANLHGSAHLSWRGGVRRIMPHHRRSAMSPHLIQVSPNSIKVLNSQLLSQRLREISSNALSIHHLGKLIKRLSEEGDLDSQIASALGQAIKTLGGAICWDESLFELWEAIEGVDQEVKSA